MRTLRYAALVLLLAPALTAGCGYTLGYRMPSGVHRLSVPIFANETFPLRREIEFELTRAVKRELEIRTDVELVTGGADAILEGTIVAFREAALTEGPLDVEQESSIDLVVRFRLIRTVDREILVEQEVRDFANFSVLRGESLATARAEAVDELAERIVEALEVW